jgi:hypothetical protein
VVFGFYFTTKIRELRSPAPSHASLTKVLFTAIISADPPPKGLFRPKI